jgi:hypothetical protein
MSQLKALCPFSLNALHTSCDSSQATRISNIKSFSFDSLKYRHIGISRKSNERFYTNYATKQYTKGL